MVQPQLVPSLQRVVEVETSFSRYVPLVLDVCCLFVVPVRRLLLTATVECC